MNNRYRIFNLSLITHAIFLCNSVCASSKPIANSAAQNQHFEEITVTARHWHESIVMAPVSIDLVEIDTRKNTLEQLDQQVSNVQIEASSVQTRLAIRGSSGYDNSLQQPVGFFIDDVAIPLGGTQLPSLFNLSQVELIKGSAGDLYGRHSEAGLLKVQSLAPSWTFDATAQLSHGYTDGANDHQMSDVLIARYSDSIVEDYLAGSVAVRIENTTGPQLNLFDSNKNGGKEDNIGIAIGFDTKVNDLTDIYWRSHISRKKSGKANMRYLTGQFSTPRFVTNYNTPTFDDKDSDIHSLKFVHLWNDLTLTAITGATFYENLFKADLDLSPAPIPASNMDLSDEMLSQEFRLSNNENDPIRWLFGLYFFNQHTDVDFTLGGSMVLPRANRVTEIKKTGLSVFGQLTQELQSNFWLTLGLRAEKLNNEGTQQFNGSQFLEYQNDVSESIILPKVSLSYELKSNSQLYASWTEGYLPAGFNYASAQGLNSFTFAKETSTNIEIGYKTKGFSDKLTFKSALFHIKTRDKQIVDLAPGFVQFISNAAETSSYGAEISANYQWENQWKSFIHVGTLNATADNFLLNRATGTNLNIINLNGNDMPFSPDISYGLGIEYQPNLGWFTKIAIAGKSDYYFDVQNTLEQPSSIRVDMALGYHFERFSVTFRADNLFNEEMYSRAVRTPVGIVVEDTNPRYFGLTIAARW